MSNLQASSEETQSDDDQSFETWSPGAGLQYQLLAQSDGARRGRYTTAHGTVQTPAFMPVGTQATVKCVLPDQVKATGAQVVLANTYHMGNPERRQLVARAGGLHELMRWQQTILTDSGGFQVFSLSDRTINEDGVQFSWTQGGDPIQMRPEDSMAIQKDLGADIVMAFDECVGYPSPRKYVEDSLARTIRWLKRCAACELAPHQHLFGIVQGGTELDLRKRSVEETCAVDLPGYAIGGVSVGEGIDLLKHVTVATAPLLPADKPRYLMGVGHPEDIVVSVAAGMDMFDCVVPTRYAREGTLFTWNGKMRIKDKKFRKDRYPIDTKCTCPVCTGGFSRAYIRHLFFAKEPLAEVLCTLHNLHFYQELMREIRRAIEEGRFRSWALEFLERTGHPKAHEGVF